MVNIKDFKLKNGIVTDKDGQVMAQKDGRVQLKYMGFVTWVDIDKLKPKKGRKPKENAV